MSEGEKELRVVVVNPREKGRKKGKMAKKKTHKKTTHKKRPSRPRSHTTHHKARRRLRTRRNPGFGFSGRNLAYTAAGAAGGVAADWGAAMIPLPPAAVGGIEAAVGAGLAAVVDHPIARAAGAVLMGAGAIRLIGALMAPKAAPATGTVKSNVVAKRPGMKGIEAVEAVGDYDGVGAVEAVGDYDGVGAVEAVGELEAVGDYDGVGDVEGVGELESVGSYEDGMGELESGESGYY